MRFIAESIGIGCKMRGDPHPWLESGKTGFFSIGGKVMTKRYCFTCWRSGPLLPVIEHLIHNLHLKASNRYGFKATFNATYPVKSGNPHG
jgi:hypothetical protein